MAQSRTAKTSAARERARRRRLELDADRARRDEQIEDAAARFYESAEAAAALREQIARVEQEMSAAIGDLLDLKEPAGRIRGLLELDAGEFARLRPTRTPVRPRPSSPAPASVTPPVPGAPVVVRADGGLGGVAVTL